MADHQLHIDCQGCDTCMKEVFGPEWGPERGAPWGWRYDEGWVTLTRIMRAAHDRAGEAFSVRPRARRV